MAWRQRHFCVVSSSSATATALALALKRVGDIFQECAWIVLCVGDSWKMVNIVLGLWLEPDRSRVREVFQECV